jgi:hypothetical protein
MNDPLNTPAFREAATSYRKGNGGKPAPSRMGARSGALMAALKDMTQIEPVTSRPYLVKHWIDRGTVSVLYGEANVGKSFLALDLAFHLAGAADDWHGNRLGEWAGPVVYIASEGGRGIANRIAALKAENAGLTVTAGTRLLLLPEALNLCATADATALCAGFRAEFPVSPALIVIDTLARSMGGGDENSSQDMGSFIRSVDIIRAATGAHVMIVHHAGKDAAKGARGHSSLRAAVDTEIQITREGAVIMAETRKQRDMEGGRSFAYTLRSVHLGEDQDGESITSCVVEPTDPVKKSPRLRGQALIAMQALDDALAHHGEVKGGGDMFPANRQCVSLERWREYCDRHSLSSGESESARRKAFHTVKNSLQEKELIRVIDGHVWRVQE